MRGFYLSLPLCCFLHFISFAQLTPNCAQKEVTNNFFLKNPAYKEKHDLLESRLLQFNKQKEAGAKNQPTTVVTLPVVIHIIHNNGAENISDLQAQTAIQHLNEAFANIGYYDPSNGVNTQIQFCLVKRSPNGTTTTGINRVVSNLTVTNGANAIADDIALKNLIRWNPGCYINIWLVSDIIGPAAGYAYLPSAHGSNVDGIVIESQYFGTSYSDDAILVHEMGHYLGLYHTFDGGCKNDDCSQDGDRVCDTPPDQSTALVGCSTSVNSCTTDPQSGFTTDVKDLTEDYMDYGNLNCMKVFTQGQADRMNWFIQNVRNSLLACLSCVDPCPFSTNASFTPSNGNFALGASINFTSTSTGANQYEWYIDGQLVANSQNFFYTFTSLGSHDVRLVATNSGSALCRSEITQSYYIDCFANAAFIPADSIIRIGSTINFTNLSIGADQYKWYVDGVLQSGVLNYSHLFNQLGNHEIRLEIRNSLDNSCTANTSHRYNVQCMNTASFIPGGSTLSVGTPVAFTSTSTYSDTFEWYINGILSGSTSTFNYNFPTEGTVTIKLIARNSADLNCQAEYSQTFMVTCPVTALFDPPGASVPNGTTVNFTNLSTNADTYEWYVNNILQGTGFNFSKQFVTVGNHKVKLVAKNSTNGCSKSFESTVSVGCTTKADFTPLGTYVVVGSTINFTNTSVFADQFEWYVNNVLQATTPNFSYTFTQQQGYFVKLVARNSASPACFDYMLKAFPTVCYDTANFVVSGTPALYNTINFTNTSAGANSYVWRVNGQQVSTNKDFSYYFASTGTYEISLTVNGACSPTKSNRYEIFPPGFTDTCYKFTHIKRFRDLNWQKLAFPMDFITLKDGGNVFMSYNHSVNYGYTKPYFIKFDRKGHLVWQKTIDGYHPIDLWMESNPIRMLSMPNGNFISLFAYNNVYGTTHGKITVLQSDQNGNTVTQNSLIVGDTTESGYVIFIKDAWLTNSNEIIIAFERTNGGYRKLFVAKTNLSGNALWADSLGTGHSSQRLQGVTVSNDTVFVTANSFEGNAQYAYLIKLRNSNGQLISSQRYGTDDGSVKVKFDKPIFAAGKFFLTGNINEPSATTLKTVRFELNPSTGVCNKGLQFHVPNTTQSAIAVFFSEDGKTGILSTDIGSTQDFDDHIFQLKDDDSLNWAYLTSIYGIPGTHWKEHRIYKTADNGWVTWDGYNSEYVKMNDSGRKIYCNNHPRIIEIKSAPKPAPVNHNLLLVSLNSRVIPGEISLKDSIYDQHSFECQDSALVCNNPLPPPDTCRDCTFLKLTGSDTVCLNSTTGYFALTDSACIRPPIFSVDTSYARIVFGADNIVHLQFKKTGLVWLYAEFHNGCRIIKDSFVVTIFNSPPTLNLGPDIQLCEISTYKLNAGTGFKSYKWQNGSTDSILTINNPGTYFVIAEDYCGNLYSDTINISRAAPVPFDLGADRAVCENDSVTITAPAGFTKYMWSPDYRISSAYTQSIKVSPRFDTTYTVIAERSPGCLVIDSIRISVTKALPLNLGNDTSFCKNNNITLDAGGGFTSYLWNTGSTGQTLRVGNAGIYSVAAVNPNSCISRDTIKIPFVYDLPKVDIGKDTSVCSNGVYVFRAANGFASYIWQDGSTNNSFTATQPGVFWVRVTDANRCINSDTALIKGVRNGPENFLALRAEICIGQKLDINVIGDFTRYRWYNNASSKSISVSSPGTYWVEVTNSDGCTGRDTIIVEAKDCAKGVFFPNAFTPNNDRFNNAYRPVVYGQLESFNMVIYNRWGEKIFETNDPVKGWDGNYKGKPQATGTFVWVARYKFKGPNEKEEFTRGTLVLVR